MTSGANGARRAEQRLPVLLEVVEGGNYPPALSDAGDANRELARGGLESTASEGTERNNGVTRKPEVDDIDNSPFVAHRQSKPRQAELSTDPVRAYLSTIGKTALLTAEQEVELSKKIEAGLYAQKVIEKHTELKAGKFQIEKVDEPKTVEEALGNHALEMAGQPQLQRDYAVLAREGKSAKDHLIEANLRLVVSVAKRYAGHGMAFLDLIQHGNIGLIHGVEKFDYHKGFKFSTYATWWIRQSITRAMADEGKTIRLPVHVAEQVNKAARTERRLSQDLERRPTSEELALELGITPERAAELMEYSKDLISLDTYIGDGEESRLGDFIEDVDTPRPESYAEFGNTREKIDEVLKTLSERERGVISLRYGLDGTKPWTLDSIGKKYALSRERVRQIERETMAKLREPERKSRLESLL